MGLDARKPVFGVSDKARRKPVSSATCECTETSLKIEKSFVAGLDMLHILSNKRITKALIRLRVCAGWSAPLLLENPRRQVLSCRGPKDLGIDSRLRGHIGNQQLSLPSEHYRYM